MLDEADKNRVPMFDEMRRNARRACVSSGIVLWVVGACAPASSDDNAVRRGDVAFARDSLEEALAEYRLAARRGDEEPRILARVAHTYLALGRVDEASEAYGRAVEKDTRYADMAAADLVQLAREASRRDDRFLMASAMEQARSFLPELGVPDLTLDLARHHFQSGEYALALPLYQRALSEGADSVPEVVLEIGQAYDESGDCRSALVFFERFRRLASAPNRGSVDFNIGRCSFQRAREIRRAAPRSPAALAEALRHVERAIDLGEPRSSLGEAWFEKGGLLSDLGECDAAQEAFQQVRFVESPSSALARRAQERRDLIRFGGGLRELRGSCG